MKKSIMGLLLLGIFIFVAFTGWDAFVSLFSGVWQALVTMFPLIIVLIKQAFGNYLTSPYFIVKVIMTIAAGFGIWFGVRGGKMLYVVVSLVALFISYGLLA